MNALLFVIDSVLTFAVYAFLLRLLLPLVRADFRNPLSQAILALTSWLVHPLRRILPPAGRVDTASVVALFAVQLAAVTIMFRLRTGVVFPIGQLLIASALALAIATLQLFSVLIFLYAILSLVAPGARSPATALLASLCEWLLAPIRRILPAAGGLDFSPLIAIVGLQALRLLITAP